MHRGVALSLFEQRQFTLSQAATLADLSVSAFIDLLGRRGVPAVDYQAEEVAVELDAAL